MSGLKPGEECPKKELEEEPIKKLKENTITIDSTLEEEEHHKTMKKKPNPPSPLILIWFPLTSLNSIFSTKPSLWELKDLIPMPFILDLLELLTPLTKLT